MKLTSQDLVVDLPDTDLLPSKHGAEVDLAVIEAGPAAAGDDVGVIVEGVAVILEAAVGAGLPAGVAAHS